MTRLATFDVPSAFGAAAPSSTMRMVIGWPKAAVMASAISSGFRSARFLYIWFFLENDTVTTPS